MNHSFAVSSINLANVNAKLRALAAKFDDLTPLMAFAAATAIGATERSFETESTPEGVAWLPLSLRTQASFVARGQRRGAHPILQVTGRLAASMTTQVSPFQAVIGTNVIYAAIQFLGGLAGRNHAAEIPARQALGLSNADESAIEQEAVRFLSALS